MKHLQTILIESLLLDELEFKCRECTPDLRSCEVLFDQEVVFDNGFIGAIQVVVPNSPSEESCWTQFVLFQRCENGLLEEVATGDVGETLDGEFHLWYKSDEYIIDVLRQKEEKCHDIQ